MQALKRILLAEDNSKDVELTLAGLQECNLANDVFVVRDGTEVLDFLHQRGQFASRQTGLPSILFLDLKMPKMNGLEVLRQIKSDATLRTLPVVMVTSSREERDIIESYNLGVNAYVVKPIDFRQFIDAIRQLGTFWAVLNETPRTAARAG